MTKFITLLIGCSLTLAVGAWAKQEDPKNKQKSKPVQKQQSAPKQFAPKQQSALKQPSAPTRVQTMPPQHQNTHAKVLTNHVPKQQANTLPAVQKYKINKSPNVHANTLNQQAPAQLNSKNVKAFRPQHQNFHAQPKSAITSAQFNPSYRIQAAQNWSGTQYNAFRSYQPQWHDQGWWRSNYETVSLIGGGWYYWDGGYWYPAWGYDERAAYYPYDGPIYSGPHARPFDQVVADVQSALQEQGYYHGEVDGLLGPLTRRALAEYQRAQGLYTTETIDEPTLQSLGMG